MSDKENGEIVFDRTQLPHDRELALHEVNSILTELKSRSTGEHFYTKKAFRRDRIIGWVILSVLVSALGWVLLYQYAAAEDLRQSLFEVCVDNNTRFTAQGALYSRVAEVTVDPSVKAALNNAADSLPARDCQGIYLDK